MNKWQDAEISRDPSCQISIKMKDSAARDFACFTVRNSSRTGNLYRELCLLYGVVTPYGTVHQKSLVHASVGVELVLETSAPTNLCVLRNLSQVPPYYLLRSNECLVLTTLYGVCSMHSALRKLLYILCMSTPYVVS